ncbi:hypothetical protein N0V82_002179 [Gnomoniopsis sp. IMI 355080]|nr:hypothetical protein N0V82_002179 [Gnomoniopsis sp. IMI 355080]
MFSSLSSAAAVVFATTVAAQTFSDCNPLKVDPSTCTPDPAFGGEANIDFTKGASDLFTAASNTGVVYGENGAEFTINATGQAPTFTSTKYLFFGTVEVKMRVAKGQGIISTIVLESDVLDEIDWEWLGGVNGEVQTNYFSKGNTATYGTLEQDVAIPGGDAIDTFHTYTLDWSATQLQWKVDGTVYRTLTYAGNEDTYPQTPMMVKIGTWCGGCSDQPGTVTWAGGAPDWSQAPFTAYYQSINIQDNSNGVANAVTYEYTDQTGSMSSIKVNTGSDSSDTTGSATTASSATGAQNTASTLSTVSASGGNFATVTTGGAPIGQVTGPAQATGSTGSNSTTTGASGVRTSTTASASGSATSSVVQGGAQKGAVNVALLGAAMFALFFV